MAARSGRQGRRELMPGVRVDLRTAQTYVGPVEYDLHGTHGSVVLSVHGGLGGADQGRLFAGSLLGSDHRILSPSRPGYLGTPLTSGRTIDEQSDLLAALLEELGIDRVGVLGVSSGSPVAYALAARHPERVWGLVSVGGVCLPDPDATAARPLQHAFIRVIGQPLARLTAAVSPAKFLAATLDETSTLPAHRKVDYAAAIMHSPRSREFFAALVARTFPYGARLPGTDNDAVQARTLDLPLARISSPTLVVHDRYDGDVPIANGEHAAASIPGAGHRWTDGGDHLALWLSEETADDRREIREFFATHAPR